MATDFTVNKADLEFILRQIRIAEATSAGVQSSDGHLDGSGHRERVRHCSRQCGDLAVRPAHGRWHQQQSGRRPEPTSVRRTRCSRA